MDHKKTTVNISEYRLKSVTVSQTPSGKYYASILFEYEYQVQEKELQKFLGLDFSMHELYRDSNGKEPAYPRYYRNAAGKCMTLTQYNTTVGHTGIARLCFALSGNRTRSPHFKRELSGGSMSLSKITTYNVA